jgi:hypothetical protein
MALDATEVQELRVTIRTKNPDLTANKTNPELNALIRYADALIHEKCKQRLLGIEYLVLFWIDTEADSTSVKGGVKSVEVGGDIKSTFGELAGESSEYSQNLYGRLFESVVNRCARIARIGLIA